MGKPVKSAEQHPLSLKQSAQKRDRELQFHTWELRLYCRGTVAEVGFRFRQLNKLCEEHLAGRYTIEVIDLLQQPDLAAC